MKQINIEVKRRLIKLAKRYALILAIGVVYLLITLYVGYGIPCLFNKLTGLQCAGCGATRMAMSLARLDFKAAFGYNQFLFITGPFILAYIVYYEITYALTCQRPSKKWDIAVFAVLVGAVVFGILRNVIPF